MSDITSKEKIFLKQHGIEKLYVHLMDIDWNAVQGAIPVTSNEHLLTNNVLKAFDSFPKELVPVIFITNKTFERIDSFDIPLLAMRAVRRCLPAYDEMDRDYEDRHSFPFRKGAIRPKEIQFDCDWTNKTKGKYFSFLNEVNRLVPADIQISATVRLHQFKYPAKTGVPPVDRGMLMVYNISDPKQYGNHNSIFESSKAEAYFNSVETYPLPLDIVLPAWSWCIVYRNKQFYQVENGLTEEDLKKASFLKSTGNHYYSVIKDTVYHDLFLRPGDEIKSESIDEKDLREATAISKKAVNSSSFTISIFELSEKEFQQHSHENIDKVYSSYH
ncbi:MAG: hypothetical protein ABI581_16370 [Sediminibacterium sp.]